MAGHRRVLGRGGVAESEIWTDARVLQAAYNRGDSFQSVYVRLNSAEVFQEFKDALTSNPQLRVKVLRQSDHYAEQSQMITRLITTLGFLIALLMAVGGVLAYAGFNNFHAATMNWQSFSQVTFAFAVTPPLLVQGIAWAAVIGRHRADSSRPSAPPASPSPPPCGSSRASPTRRVVGTHAINWRNHPLAAATVREGDCPSRLVRGAMTRNTCHSFPPCFSRLPG